MYTIVKVLEDGNCFFRCISLYILKSLIKSERFNNGRCKNRSMFSNETDLAESLRNICVNYISENKKQYLSKNIDNCSIYLEDETIKEHLERMKNNGEFVENLELKAISDIYKLNVKVWVLDNDENLNLIDTKGNYNETINLLLCDNQHFDYLVLNNQTDDENNIQSETNESVKILLPIEKVESDVFISYKLKTIDIKQGYLIKTNNLYKLNELKKKKAIKIDNDLWFTEIKF